MGAQRRPERLALVALSLVLAALEVAHPTWTSGAIYAAVAPVVDWWLLDHVLLIVLFGSLAWGLARLVADEAPNSGSFGTAARLLLGLFAVSNTAFLATDGIGTGLLVIGANPADQAAVEQSLDALWNSPLVAALANLTGALWALSLAACALALYPAGRQLLPLVGVAVALALFVSGAVAPLLPLALPTGLSRVVAIAAGALVVYQAGAAALPFALLVFAAVLPQHVGAEAVFGLVCVALALLGRLRWRDERVVLGKAQR